MISCFIPDTAICVFLSSVRLARELSILLTFPKNQLFVSLIFSIVLLLSVSLISATMSFLLLALGLLLFYFPRFFRWELILMWNFTSFLMYSYSTTNLPRSTALAVSHEFWHFRFYPLWYLFLFETSSTHTLFKSVLFSLQVFVDLPVIFLLFVFILMALW